MAVESLQTWLLATPALTTSMAQLASNNKQLDINSNQRLVTLKGSSYQPVTGINQLAMNLFQGNRYRILSDHIWPYWNPTSTRYLPMPAIIPGRTRPRVIPSWPPWVPYASITHRPSSLGLGTMGSQLAATGETRQDKFTEHRYDSRLASACLSILVNHRVYLICVCVSVHTESCITLW